LNFELCSLILKLKIMQLKVINPYAFLGTQHKEALDFIGTNLPPDPTFEQLNELLIADAITTDPDHPTISGFAAMFAATILPNAYNGYVNRHTKGNAVFTEKQQKAITELLEGLEQVAPAEIGDFLAQAEEDIVKRGLTYEEQLPLFIAVAIAKADFEYWDAHITTPGVWAVYIDANPAISYMYLAGIVTSSIQGVLLTYGLMKKPEIQLLDIYISLIGATGLAAGKVVFGWMGEVVIG
jgi:hypothetical protein